MEAWYILVWETPLLFGMFYFICLPKIKNKILCLACSYQQHVETVRLCNHVPFSFPQVLMDMFYQGDNSSSMAPSPLPPTPRTSLSYEEVVKELIHDEKQYQRDLHMIIRVFREELVKIVKDPKVRVMVPVMINGVHYGNICLRRNLTLSSRTLWISMKCL